ncbi:MAG: type II secretion system F family protein [Candidatus Omnitrophica bacterium]|nr:type II secretion system F family protein [Candidatus Omnitrophota bacterium]
MNGIRVKLADVQLFTERLGTLLHAGIPLIRSLTTLGNQTENEALKKVLAGIRREVEGGGSFSEALARYPGVFNDYYVHLIRTGEAGGIMEGVLGQLARSLEKEIHLRESVLKAFTYPVIVLVIACLAVTFLMIFIVPVFAKTYDMMHVTLPLPTLILVGLSRWMIRFGWSLPIIISGLIWGYKRFGGVHWGKVALDRFKLRAPLFGDLNRKVAVSRFVRTLGSLITSGVNMIESLRVTREVSGNVVISAIVAQVEAAVSQGERVVGPLKKADLFPPMVTEMFAAGEEAGALDEMLGKAADFLDRDVDQTVGRLVSLLEPLLTLLLACLIGFIAMAIYLPMFDLIREVAVK